MRGTAVVTGAARGIGLAISRRLLSDGFEVLAVDRDDIVLEVARDLGARGAVLDVTDADAVIALTEQAPGCRVLINNAAIQVKADLLTTTHHDMRSLLDVNVIAPVLMAQALVPTMGANGGGSIVNLSSIVSRAHAAGSSLYSTSKAAINQLTQAMAVEFGELGVRCNAVGPGTVLTELTAANYGTPESQRAIAGVLPVPRIGDPTDIARAVSFLCSDEAAWITGQVLFVDGGFGASHGQFFRTARRLVHQTTEGST